NTTIAFAVTYFLGVITTIFVLSRLGPRLMGVDVAAACREMEVQMGAVSSEPDVVSGYFEFIVRAYTVPPALDGKTAADLEGMFSGARVFVVRARRHGQVVAGDPGLRFRVGDGVALAGRHEMLVGAR